MIRLIKKFWSPQSRSYQFVRNWYKNLGNETWDFDILDAFSRSKKNIFFIQIGANDGQPGDPIVDYIKSRNWSGILVEPIPYLFERLKKNYGPDSGNLIFENSAVADRDGSMKFYRLRKNDSPGLPDWYEQIGSFRKDVILKHRSQIPRFDELLLEEDVKTITFASLLKKHAVSRVDLLHSDTEGYDFEILKLIPFQDLNIGLVMFEHKHLSKEDYKSAKKLLERHGFVLKKRNRTDSIAVASGLLTSLRED